jgi:hypothetical protein
LRERELTPGTFAAGKHIAMHHHLHSRNRLPAVDLMPKRLKLRLHFSANQSIFKMQLGFK